MYSIYVDDERTPKGKFDIVCRTTNDAVKAVRRKYKEGVRHFYLDLDHDTPDDLYNEHGGNFLNVLKQIDYFYHSGRMKDIIIDVHIHTGNVVGRINIQNFIKDHSSYLKEIIG